MTSQLVNSADSHVVEPLDLWVQRLPKQLRRRAPRIEEVDGRWLFVVEGMPPRRMSAPTEEADKPKKATGFRAGGSDPDKRNYIVSNQRLREAGFEARRSLDDGIRELLTGYSMFGRGPFRNI